MTMDYKWAIITMKVASHGAGFFMGEIQCDTRLHQWPANPIAERYWSGQRARKSQRTCMPLRFFL